MNAVGPGRSYTPWVWNDSGQELYARGVWSALAASPVTKAEGTGTLDSGIVGGMKRPSEQGELA
jgi:hypothetical protein